MRLLLDTHIFLWYIVGDKRIGALARATIENADSVYVSVATLWEATTKYRLGKLALPEPPHPWLATQREEHGFVSLVIDEASVAHLPSLDVHQATVVVSVRDEQGLVVMRATVATEAKAIVGLVRGLGSRVHIVFEEGTQAQWLHEVLKPYAERVVVCNTRGRGAQDNKSDRIDADRLSELLRLGSVKSVFHGASELLTLKELVRSYANLVEDGTRVMLRILALMATPWRFRTKRQAWPYVGLAVVTRSSADQEFADGKLRRRRRAPLTRGLNRNHHPLLKSVFKGAANAAAATEGPLKDFYDACVARGVREDMAKRRRVSLR